MFQWKKFDVILLAVLTLIGIIYSRYGGYYGIELLCQIAILSMLAVSLDMVAGYGGMISLCHGALFGFAAYIYAILTSMLGVSVPAAMLLALLTTGIIAGLIALCCHRMQGIFFIMTSLAFGQMGYAYFFESPYFGGDDGMVGIPRLDLSVLGVDLSLGENFAIILVLSALMVTLFAGAILRSGLGRMLVAVNDNEKRSMALGLHSWQVKMVIFASSGCMAGLAGIWSAQLSMFVSPDILYWTSSGEALIIVILGGIGTIIGPILGAIAIVLIKFALSQWTDYWHIFIGILLIAVIYYQGKGMYGLLDKLLPQRKHEA